MGWTFAKYFERKIIRVHVFFILCAKCIFSCDFSSCRSRRRLHGPGVYARTTQQSRLFQHDWRSGRVLGQRVTRAWNHLGQGGWHCRRRRSWIATGKNISSFHKKKILLQALDLNLKTSIQNFIPFANSGLRKLLVCFLCLSRYPVCYIYAYWKITMQQTSR